MRKVSVSDNGDKGEIQMAKPNLTVTVYAGPNCRACEAAIEWLRQRGVEADQRSYEEAPFQVWSLPVIVLGDEVVTGFHKAKLSEILRRSGK